MSTFADDIEAAAEGEPIEAVVIGNMGWGGARGADERHRPGLDRKGEVLTWAEARALLDYEYHIGFGSPDCHAVYAWTASRVLFVSQYDGATEVERVSRHPAPVVPEMPGG